MSRKTDRLLNSKQETFVDGLAQYMLKLKNIPSILQRVKILTLATFWQTFLFKLLMSSQGFTILSQGNIMLYSQFGIFFKRFDQSFNFVTFLRIHFHIFCYLRKFKSIYKITKVKLAKFGQPKLAQIRPVESLVKNCKTMKSYTIIGKPNNTSLFLIIKCSLIWIRTFICLDFRTCILLIYRKTTDKNKKIVF